MTPETFRPRPGPPPSIIAEVDSAEAIEVKVPDGIRFHTMRISKTAARELLGDSPKGWQAVRLPNNVLWLAPAGFINAPGLVVDWETLREKRFSIKHEMQAFWWYSIREWRKRRSRRPSRVF